MKKEAFLRDLECLLSDLPEDEKAEAVGYYRDYFEEAGRQDEEEIIGRLGSPEKVAAEIRAGFLGSSQGEFTERGYQDERFREAYYVPDQYAGIVPAAGKGGSGPGNGGGRADRTEQDPEDCGWTSFEKEGRSCREEWSKWRKEWEKRFERTQGQSGDRQRQKSGNSDRGLIILLLVILFGLPAAGTLIGAGFSIAGGIIGGIFGIFGGVFSVVIAVFAAALAAFGGGIALIFSGAADWSVPTVSLMSIGGGFLLLALTMLLLILAKWGCTVAVPWMIRLIRDIIHSCAAWLREISGRIFGDRRDRL